MHRPRNRVTTSRRTGGAAFIRVMALVGLSVFFGSGCAAVSFPETGIPVFRVPPEFLGWQKDPERTINLALLTQQPPDAYRLGPGDLLGVWVDGVFAVRGETPPVFQTHQENKERPATGIPILIHADGTIDLPALEPIQVSGMTLREAKIDIQRAYVASDVLQDQFARIIVTLAARRVHQVLVFRQEGDDAVAVDISQRSVNRIKRGTGHLLELPAYQNDVGHALARSGGLPGLEAYNSIIIHRKRFNAVAAGQELKLQLEEGVVLDDSSYEQIVIPLRLPPGEPLSILPEDIILKSGDVVFVEARDSEVFYTGGLLPTGEFTLPRDYDLDVVEAVARVRGSIVNGGLTPAQLVADNHMLNGDIGGPSPGMVIVLRKTPDGGHIPIRVDLNKAIRDPFERIIIQPGDVVLLQQTPGQALSRYLTNIISGEIIWRVFARGDATGVANLIVP